MLGPKHWPTLPSLQDHILISALAPTSSAPSLPSAPANLPLQNPWSHHNIQSCWERFHNLHLLQKHLSAFSHLLPRVPLSPNVTPSPRRWSGSGSSAGDGMGRERAILRGGSGGWRRNTVMELVLGPAKADSHCRIYLECSYAQLQPRWDNTFWSLDHSSS